ncbi:MAG: UDP-3-O-(3-hydroxymyristoyl)glucosamine N-acyltransferase [Gammaproteobacteria bacterium]|nr:UDP-3-O-(3-hydroxymyristoyl)glucosamine N-acyltransferase [Gammaproteobacteria bacterium]
MGRTVAEIARYIDAEVAGDGAAVIDGLGSLQSARAGELSHLSSPSYRQYLSGTKATGVILAKDDAADCPTNALIVANPYYAFACASQLFEERPRGQPGVHEAAVVDPEANLGANVSVGPLAVVMAGARVGDNVEIGAGAYVGNDAVIGRDSIVMANATIHYRVVMGERCVVHSGAVIGADGFGFTADAAGRLQAIAQIGAVRLGDDVSVGACTAIDRGAIDDTVIGDGVKIDNLCQIGHNCIIGAHTLICGCVGIVGSTKIGRHCVLAGGAGVGGDGPIELCDGVVLSAPTYVARSITEPGVYSGGVLHNTTRRWKRNVLRFGELDDLAKRLARLERKIGKD